MYDLASCYHLDASEQQNHDDRGHRKVMLFAFMKNGSNFWQRNVEDFEEYLVRGKNVGT